MVTISTFSSLTALAREVMIMATTSLTGAVSSPGQMFQHLHYTIYNLEPGVWLTGCRTPKGILLQDKRIDPMFIANYLL